jgi:hypothetical protein
VGEGPKRCHGESLEEIPQTQRTANAREDIDDQRPRRSRIVPLQDPEELA